MPEIAYSSSCRALKIFDFETFKNVSTHFGLFTWIRTFSESSSRNFTSLWPFFLTPSLLRFLVISFLLFQQSKNLVLKLCGTDVALNELGLSLLTPHITKQWKRSDDDANVAEMLKEICTRHTQKNVKQTESNQTKPTESERACRTVQKTFMGI